MAARHRPAFSFLSVALGIAAGAVTLAAQTRPNAGGNLRSPGMGGRANA